MHLKKFIDLSGYYHDTLLDGVKNDKEALEVALFFEMLVAEYVSGEVEKNSNEPISEEEYAKLIKIALEKYKKYLEEKRKKEAESTNDTSSNDDNSTDESAEKNNETSND